jgi:hypothetical protein
MDLRFTRSAASKSIVASYGLRVFFIEYFLRRKEVLVLEKTKPSQQSRAQYRAVSAKLTAEINRQPGHSRLSLPISFKLEVAY